MGENYALGAHRLQTVLDHSPYSIFNLHTYPQARSYKAIVDPTGNQDFTDIQAAIDYVHGLGGGAIFIKAGTYNLISNIEIPSNISLVGEGPGLTIFNFGNASRQIKITGIDRSNSETNYSISSGSKVLTGNGGNWLSTIFPEDYVKLDYFWYRIFSVDSDNQLTLYDYYRGPNISNKTWLQVYYLVENIVLENFSVKGYSGSSGPIYTRYVINSRISGVLSSNNSGYGFDFLSCFNSTFEALVSTSNSNVGFRISSCDDSLLRNCSSFGNGSHGFNFSGDYYVPFSIISCESHHNSGSGFVLAQLRNASFVGCSAYRNTVDGFRLASSAKNRIVSCSADSNSGYGVNLADSGSSNIIIVGNNLYDNTLGKINDVYNQAQIGHNV
jgi:parallel beta-helix repeat protein